MEKKLLNGTADTGKAAGIENYTHESVKNESTSINFINLKHYTLNSGAVLRGFYLLIGLSILVVLYLAYRGLRLRRSRIERRYGTNKTNDTQELTPLPVGIIADDEDSDGEDQTIFELQHISNRN
ncbi:uncharacterized membrane protein C19orf24 homolog [Ctenocephalides felis]|uniref:uncharacterized membrane protein C19orf24 homolog n=1 Tax=Ctenocephalides felis TaxID=7515 RepID=UPI000E6E2F8B|nr:uncharacterized membrane protein C19orf24 homolog [Ctenocephalides felis]